MIYKWVCMNENIRFQNNAVCRHTDDKEFDEELIVISFIY